MKPTRPECVQWYARDAILKQWGSKTQAELYEFGEKAKRFILENKNSEIQASRLMNFIKHS